MFGAGDCSAVQASSSPPSSRCVQKELFFPPPFFCGDTQGNYLLFSLIFSLTLSVSFSKFLFFTIKDLVFDSLLALMCANFILSFFLLNIFYIYIHTVLAVSRHDDEILDIFLFLFLYE